MHHRVQASDIVSFGLAVSVLDYGIGLRLSILNSARMTDKEYEQSIRKQLSELFNKGFEDFAKYRDNRPVYDMCIRQHLDKAKMLTLMNTDLEQLCKRISLDFKGIIEEEYRRASGTLI